MKILNKIFETQIVQLYKKNKLGKYKNDNIIYQNMDRLKNNNINQINPNNKTMIYFLRQINEKLF